jgi:hypothetical protein
MRRSHSIDRGHHTAFRQSVADFACVCKAGLRSVPRLGDFLGRRAIPSAVVRATPVPTGIAAYIGALPVVDANNFAMVCRHVGDRVELVGQVVEVRPGKTQRGKPYVFVNFRRWRDNCVRLTIWSEGLKALGYTPDATWVGKWLPGDRQQRVGADATRVRAGSEELAVRRQ